MKIKRKKKRSKKDKNLQKKETKKINQVQLITNSLHLSKRNIIFKKISSKN